MSLRELIVDLLPEQASRGVALGCLEYVGLEDKVLLFRCIGDRVGTEPRLWGLISAVALHMRGEVDRLEVCREFYCELDGLAQIARSLYRAFRGDDLEDEEPLDPSVYRHFGELMRNLLIDFSDARVLQQNSSESKTISVVMHLHPLAAAIERTGSPTGWRQELPLGARYVE